MPNFERNYFQFNDNSKINKDSVQYSVNKKDVNKECRTLFDHYNTDGDKKLGEEELTELMLDLKNADSDEDDVISSKEANKLLKSMKTGKNKKVTKTERKNFFKFLNSIQKNYMNNISNNSDGIIDEANQQGATGVGDCWMLSQMRGMSKTEWGAKAIKDSISQDKETGTYKVNLKGVNFEAEITQKEIDKARKDGQTLQNGKGSPYTSGDLDALLLELSVEKYFKQEIDNGNLVRRDKILFGNQMAGKTSLQYMLTGKTGHQYQFTTNNVEKAGNTSSMDEVSISCWKNVQDYVSMTTGDKKEMTQELLKNIFSDTDEKSVTCALKNGNIAHAYTIKDIKLDKDDNIEEVLLINPTASQIVAHYSLDELTEKLLSIAVTNESDNYDAYNEGFIPHPRRIED